MKKQTLLFIVLIASLVLSACRAGGELEKNREKWNAQGIGHYRFELTVSCFCAFMDIMPVAVEVKGGKVVSMTGADGQPVSGESRQYFDEAATVEGLFALAAKNLKEAEQVEVKYDAAYGFPTSIVVDMIKLAVDDEISYYVGSFKALP